MTEKTNLTLRRVISGLPMRISTSICLSCGGEVERSSYECPHCGALVGDVPEPVFHAAFAWEIKSRNFNGVYKIYRLSDGSPVCTCKDFLFQKQGKLEPDGSFMVCKHILESDLLFELTGEFQNIQPWQRIVLKKLGIIPVEGLSSEQANFIIGELLQQNGVSYGELIALLKLNSAPELLPLYFFGVELEGLVWDKELLQEKLNDIEIESIITDYDHTLLNRTWKLGDDGSVSRRISGEEERHFESVELTSPKLWGYRGFDEIRQVLSKCEEVGGKVNGSCGFHVHVNVSSFTLEELRRLALVWAKIEPVIFFLVSPSRRNNSYCQWLRKNIENFTSIVSPFSSGFRVNRYCSLNLDAINHYGTVEFRIHQGTLNADKVTYWVTFCLKLMQKVKEGLKHFHFSKEPSIEEVLDKIGIVENAIPLIKRCREFLIARYEKFRAEAEMRPAFREFDNYFLSDVRIFIMEDVNMFFQGRHAVKSLVREDKQAPPNSVTNLVSTALSEKISLSYKQGLAIFESRDKTGTIKFPSLKPDSDVIHTVKYDSVSEEITCSCHLFKKHARCMHSICIARIVFLKRLLDKLEKFNY